MLVEVAATLIAGLVSLYFWLYHFKWWIFFPELSKMPRCPPHWLTGNMTELPKNGDGVWKGMQKRHQQLGPVHQFAFMWMRQVHLHSVEAIKAVAQSPTNISKSDFYTPLLPWLGNSLLTSSGARWKAKRRLLTPAFHFKILQNYLSVNTEQTGVFLDLIAERSKKEEFIDVQHPIGQLTLDIIIRTAFDCSFSAQKGDAAALEYLRNLNELAYEYFNTFQKKNIASLHEFTLRVIKERVEKNTQGLRSKSYQDFLQMLLESKYEDGSALTMEDVRAEVDTFMVTIQLHLVLGLAAHPDVQERARREVQSVMGNRLHITHDDLNKLVYLNAAIKEAMRVYPPVPFISRVLDEPIDVCGYRIPQAPILPQCSVSQGMNVSLSAYLLHYNPEVWPEPEKYNPERFMRDDDRPYAYIPFSAGPRNCIGQVFAMNEMKGVTAMTLRRFRLAPDPTREPIIEPAVVLRSANGIHLKFEPLV